MHFSKKSGHLSSAGSEILAFGSHCLANFQPILVNIELKYENSENIKACCINIVVFKLVRGTFFGTLGIEIHPPECQV